MLNRHLRKIFPRTGPDSDVWPVVLLLFAVLIPAACLLWFMGAAMRHERLAARQQLIDSYRSQLAASQVQLDRQWHDTFAALASVASSLPPALAFQECVRSGRVDSLVLLDSQGRVLYPIAPVPPAADPADPAADWAEASRVEYFQKDPAAAAPLYQALAEAAATPALAARAWQARARCLVQSGQADAAIRLVVDKLGDARFDRAADLQGRLIVANAELLALELMTNHAAPAFQTVANRLQARLNDYSHPALAAPQRRFLMKELLRLAPDARFPTLAAEDLAARWVDASARSEPGRFPLANVWQWTTPDGQLTALVRNERLAAEAQALIQPPSLPSGARVALLPPGTEHPAALVSLPAGPALPGWHLALSFTHPGAFDTAARTLNSAYLWTGLFVLAAMAVLTVLAVRLVRRQTALARLKNDLAATVSHELKTPLASMRVLVDTLLDAERLDEPTVREYLRLIAGENERLTRLIQNFLTFSRMEKQKHTFQFAHLPARQIVDAAVNAVRERLTAPGCRFELLVADPLPAVRADPDALVTALINLLDNACKFSGDHPHIILRAYADNGRVLVSVHDHGVGIPPNETNRIFQPFHQAEQRLSRQGSGCGLGLSIVQFILRAHQGTVSVVSQPGAGSTFTLSLPAAPAAAALTREAVA
jgi:signal transduction histidine kinase